MAKRARNRILLAVLSAALSLVFVEIFLEAMGTRPRYRAHWKTTLPQFELQDDYLYRVRPQRPHASSEFNADGYRGPDPRAKSGRKRLLALGDSFFMGLNVAADQTLPSALERELGDRYEVLNQGVYGYGPDQLLVRHRAEGTRYEADAVLLGVYAENDFNDLAKNRVYRYDQDGSLELNPENPVREVLPLTHLELFLRQAFTGHFLPPAREQELAILLLSDTSDILSLLPNRERRAKISMMRSVLKAFAADSRADGVPLFVVVIPSLSNVQEPDNLVALGVGPTDFFVNERTVARLAADAGLPVLNLSGPLADRHDEELYQPFDNHFTPHGNAVAAGLIAEWLLAQGL